MTDQATKTYPPNAQNPLRDNPAFVELVRCLARMAAKDLTDKHK